MMHMMSVCEKRKLTKISLQNFIILQKEPPQPLCKRGVLKYFAIFIEKNLCWSLFSGLPVCNFLKKRLQNCFPVNTAKFLRTIISKAIYE